MVWLKLLNEHAFHLRIIKVDVGATSVENKLDDVIYVALHRLWWKVKQCHRNPLVTRKMWIGKRYTARISDLIFPLLS